MKKIWSKPDLKSLDVEKTLVGAIDQFPESQETQFTSNGETLLGNS